MHYVKKTLVATCLALATGQAYAAQPVAAVPSAIQAIQGKFLRVDESVSGEYVVVLKEQPRPGLPDLSGLASELTRQYAVDVFMTYQHALRGFAIRATEAQAMALAADSRVAFVEENSVIRVAGSQNTPPSWGLDRIDQEDRPLNGVYNYENEANGVNVYVIDTGIAINHSDFEGRASVAFDSTGGNGIDCHGHGTIVAGIVGGAKYGVAKKARLHSVRVAGCDAGTNTTLLVGGVDWVTANAVKPSIVNVSMAAPRPIAAIDTAVTNSVNSNLTYVVAAGNSTPAVDACNFSPSRVPSVITVGASDKNDVRWANSNYGTCLDMFAPGAEIASASHTDPNGEVGGNGTSFAAPHVAGAAAILLAKGISTASIPQLLIDDAALNKIVDPGAGSPNRLLYTLRPKAGQLLNGVPVTVQDTAGGQKNFSMVVPPGVSKLTFSITGGSGDADLYVRYNAIPETYAYDCRPFRAGNEEVCTFTDPSPGTWFVQLRAYQTYTTTLKGQH